MATLDLTSTAQAPAFIGSGELYNNKITSNAVTPAFQGTHELDNNKITSTANAPAFTGQGSLSVVQNIGLAGAGVAPAFTGASDMRVIYDSDNVPDYVEVQHAFAQGGISLAAGPLDTLVVAGSDGMGLLAVNTVSARRVSIVGERSLTARPISIASTPVYLYVLLEKTRASNWRPVLEVRDNTDATFPLIASYELAQDVSPHILWAAGDGYTPGGALEADFIVVAAEDGGIDFRTADALCTVIDSVNTGIYRPRVVDVIRQFNAEREGANFSEKVWDVVLLSETTAQGTVVRRRATTNSLPSVVNSAVTTPAFTGAGSLGVSLPVVSTQLHTFGGWDNPDSTFNGASASQPAVPVFELTVAGDIDVVFRVHSEVFGVTTTLNEDLYLFDSTNSLVRVLSVQTFTGPGTGQADSQPVTLSPGTYRLYYFSTIFSGARIEHTVSIPALGLVLGTVGSPAQSAYDWEQYASGDPLIPAVSSGTVVPLAAGSAVVNSELENAITGTVIRNADGLIHARTGPGRASLDGFNPSARTVTVSIDTAGGAGTEYDSDFGADVEFTVSNIVTTPLIDLSGSVVLSPPYIMYDRLINSSLAGANDIIFKEA